MEFQTKIIVKKKNPRARVAIAGVFLLLVSVIFSLMDGYESYALWGFGISLLLLIGGAIYAKGDLASIGVSDTDFVLTVSEIRVGNDRYPLTQLKELVFKVEGYDGMRTHWGNRSDREDYANGMKNYCNFEYAGTKEEWQFYLPDPVHVQQLGGVFKELYAARIEFMERNWGYRTFLFEPMTDEQWEDKMIENGYK